MSMTYQFDEASEIRGQDLIGETVVLSENECRGLIDCTFSSGTLKLAQSKGAASILLTTVKESDVVAVKRQRDYPLFQARFVNSRFHGVFSGIDFGHKDDAEFHEDFGTVDGCDFTDATVDGCRFFNVDVSTLRLPAWPHAILLEPHKRLADVARFEWPGLLGKYMEIKEPQSVKAVVMHIPSLARLVQSTEEEIKTAFEKFGGLQM
jgi:hypothetical protein